MLFICFHDYVLCLSQIQLAVGGSGFAFTKLDCSNKELADLDIV